MGGPAMGFTGAAIWVVFGHSAVISKDEKWSAYNRDLNLGS